MYNTAKALVASRRRPKVDEDALATEAEEGFTLIELMVVLLIMAILMAIAIPTFLGVTSSAHDRAAQSNLRNAFETAQTIWTSNQQYLPNSQMSAAMASSEPSLAFEGLSVNLQQNSNQVGVDSLSDSAIVLASAASSQRCWFLANAETESGVQAIFGSSSNLTPGTYYGLIQSDKHTCEAGGYTSVTDWTPNKFPVA